MLYHWLENSIGEYRLHTLSLSGTRVAYSGLERRYPGLIRVEFQEEEGFHLFQMLDFISATRLMIG